MIIFSFIGFLPASSSISIFLVRMYTILYNNMFWEITFVVLVQPGILMYGEFILKLTTFTKLFISLDAVILSAINE